MKLINTFLLKAAVFAAFWLIAFSVSSFAQNMRAEGYASVTGVKNETEKKSPTVRAVKSESEKQNPARKFSAAAIYELERQTLVIINQKRAAAGLSPLAWSDEIAKVARHHSENMVEFNFFSHAGRDGSMVDDRADTFGIGKWRSIGENIAYNRGFENPVATAIEKWMLSRSHRENILSSQWTETGIGIAVKPDGAFYFTQVFLTK